MDRLLTSVLLSVTLVPTVMAASGPERPAVPATAATAASATPAASDPTAGDAVPAADTLYKAVPPLPAAPRGKSTVIGGMVASVDPVQDILTIHVYGGHEMKIYFDERTQFYRDGVRTPLSALRPEERASVETVLDGTNIYALSVHMLSQTPQGQAEGQVVRYDSAEGVLWVQNRASGIPIKVHVAASTAIARVGQPGFMSQGEGLSDLQRGALVQLQFEPDNQGGGLADRISILATPGAAFEFAGKVTYFDLHAAEIALVDPRDDNNYTIYFNPATFPAARDLHDGSNVRVKASFDGSRYVASDITIQ